MVCDKVVCERLCERWCVTKWSVKDCVSGLVCERPSAASLLIPLQTVLLRTPTDAARRWASDPYSFQYACLYLCSSRVSFLRFPHFPNGFLDFLGFSRRFFQACHLSFPTIEGFFHNFPLFFKDFPSFSLVFPYLFPTVFKGPESNPTVTKLPSDTFPQKLDDGWPESEKHVLQAALSMVVVKNSRWMVGEFYMSYGGESCEITHRRFYTQTLSQTRLHTETFTHRRFYTQTLLHADAFTHRRFYTQMLLHTNTFTDAITHRDFYTQTLLHTDTFTRRRFYTQALWHADAFTHRSFYTQTLLHTNAFTHRPFYTQTLLHTDAFTHRRFYTQMLLHTHTHFHTQRLLHTEAFEECLYMTFYGPELKLFCFWHQAHDGIELCCKRLQKFH